MVLALKTSAIKIQIRLSTPQDAEKILYLQRSSLKGLSSSYNSTQIESLIRSQGWEILKKSQIGFVAENNNEIVGFASVMISPPQISGIFVHPDFTRQGIGTQLLNTLEKIAIEQGVKVINVASSLDAVDFYKAFDYKLNYKSGFYSESKIWIPCQHLKKQLIIVSKFQKIRRTFIVIFSRLKSIFSFIILIIIGTLIFMLLPLIISLIISLFNN